MAINKKDLDTYIQNICVETLESEKTHIFKHLKTEWTTDIMLKERAKKENILGSTVFCVSKNEITKLIKEALKEYSSEIIDWLNDESDGEPYIVTNVSEEKIGYGFMKKQWHDWDKGPCNCHETIVVLKKIERKYDSWFRVASVYPIPVESDKEEVILRKK